MMVRTRLTCFCLLFMFFANIKAIKVIGRDGTVTAGDDAQLFCEAIETTEPLTTIWWQRRTKKKPTNTDFLVITSSGKEEHINGLRDRVKFAGNLAVLDGSILLSNVTLLDEGIYTCIFSIFPSGRNETEIRLTVQVPPVVTVGTDVPAVAGDTEGILATCTAANAKPAAEVSWSLGALNNTVKVQNTVTVDSEDRYTVKSNLIGTASKDLNQKKVQCVVTHPGLKQELELNYILNIHSTESKTCWTLFILTLVAVCCFLFWKFELFQRVNKILRRDISQPVRTESPDHEEEH
ncbi:nectin-4-like [Tachysurus fulvidraco]|uniref:nectin-4-like n=1 Tax=Tachysurus fulvidraco TaxID=1234273 RepID=UPI001FEF4AD1|nr:nectin-4-like [Tachysurus fulvidraco]